MAVQTTPVPVPVIVEVQVEVKPPVEVVKEPVVTINSDDFNQRNNDFETRTNEFNSYEIKKNQEFNLREMYEGNFRIVYSYESSQVNIIKVIRAERDFQSQFTDESNE